MFQYRPFKDMFCLPLNFKFSRENAHLATEEDSSATNTFLAETAHKRLYAVARVEELSSFKSRKVHFHTGLNFKLKVVEVRLHTASGLCHQFLLSGWNRFQTSSNSIDIGIVSHLHAWVEATNASTTFYYASTTITDGSELILEKSSILAAGPGW